MALPGSDRVKDNITSFKKLNMMAKVKQYISCVVTTDKKCEISTLFSVSLSPT
jgi:hypothetical protein